jgi:hypothetical protein
VPPREQCVFAGQITCLAIDTSGYYVATGETSEQQGGVSEYSVTLFTVVGDAVTSSHMGVHERMVTNVAFSSAAVTLSLQHKGAPIKEFERFVASTSLDESVRIYTFDNRSGRQLKARDALRLTERLLTLAAAQKRPALIERPLTQGQREEFARMKRDLKSVPKDARRGCVPRVHESAARRTVQHALIGARSQAGAVRGGAG